MKPFLQRLASCAECLVSCYPNAGLPNAIVLGKTSMMFVVHPTLTEINMARTAEVIGDIMEKASKD